MAYLHRLIFALLLFLISVQASALEPNWTWRPHGGGSSYSSGDACVSALENSWRNQYPQYVSCASFAHSSGVENGAPWSMVEYGGCAGGFSLCWGSDPVCPAGYKLEGLQCIEDGPKQCAQGSELVDGQCVCKPGYIQGDGACYPDPDKACAGLSQWCTDKKGFSTLFKGKGQSADFFCHAAEKFIAGAGGGSSWEPEFPGCSKGCMVISGGTTVSVKDDGGQWWTEGTGKYVGSVCNPDVVNKLNEGTPEEKEVTPPGTKDPGKCNGQPGTVNGVAVCLPYGEAEGDKKTNTTVNSDGSKTKTETVTKCNGGQCTTTTTTTNIDKDGNISGGGSSTSTVPQGDYCARNPASAVCKALDPSKPPGSGTGGTGGTGSGDGGGGDDDTDKSSFGGSCGGGWTCEGDAIQCAVAREQHKRACELFEDRDNDAYRLYEKERDKEGSVLGSLKGNKDIDVSQYVNDRDDFIGSGSCPADKVIQFSYGEVTVPYSRLCPYLEMLGTVLIICAGIAGARIITRRDS